MTDKRELGRRFFVAAMVGTIVFVLSMLAAWRSAFVFFSPLQEGTVLQFMHIDHAIESFGSIFEDSARTVNDVRLVYPGLFENSQNQVLDAWGHPFHFEFKGTRLIATSYGRDGQPGGIGLDADISSDRRNNANLQPTLSQFLFDLPIRPAIVISLLSSALCFLLTLGTIKAPKFNVAGVLILALWIPLLVGLSLYFGLVMIMTLKSGH
jgi:hypothetical protein